MSLSVYWDSPVQMPAWIVCFADAVIGVWVPPSAIWERKSASNHATSYFPGFILEVFWGNYCSLYWKAALNSDWENNAGMWKPCMHDRTHTHTIVSTRQRKLEHDGPRLPGFHSSQRALLNNEKKAKEIPANCTLVQDWKTEKLYWNQPVKREKSVATSLELELFLLLENHKSKMKC